MSSPFSPSSPPSENGSPSSTIDPTQPIPFDVPSPTSHAPNVHPISPAFVGPTSFASLNVPRSQPSYFSGNNGLQHQQTLDMDALLDPSLEPHGDIPNTPLAVACIAFLLGAVFAAGLGLALFPPDYWWAGRELGFYISCWAMFHWAEFAVTAGWNRTRLTVDSFLLNNFAEYHYAHAVALGEYFVEKWFWPGMKRHPRLSALGMVITLCGQGLRSLAMVHAASNFSHSVVTRRTRGHELVTTGVYAWMRHPSYAGFFYWALGTQIAMLSPVSFFGFWMVMYWFFLRRIRVEERFLMFFFGEEYRKYRARVWSGVPFIW